MDSLNIALVDIRLFTYAISDQESGIGQRFCSLNIVFIGKVIGGATHNIGQNIRSPSSLEFNITSHLHGLTEISRIEL